MALSASVLHQLRTLQQKKFRKKTGLFVAEGVKVVQELLMSQYTVRSIYATKEANIDVSSSDIGPVAISDRELNRVSSMRTPNKVLAVAEIPIQSPINWGQRFILGLDAIRDPGNLGTIVRTAKWFGINTLICSEDCADAFSPKVVQSSMGAIFHVHLSFCDLVASVDEASKHNFNILSATMNGDPIIDQMAEEKTLLVIGSESHGVREDITAKSTSLITIPNREAHQHIESLNAAVATGILLSELTSKTA